VTETSEVATPTDPDVQAIAQALRQAMLAPAPSPWVRAEFKYRANRARFCQVVEELRRGARPDDPPQEAEAK